MQYTEEVCQEFVKAKDQLKRIYWVVFEKEPKSDPWKDTEQNLLEIKYEYLFLYGTVVMIG